MFQYTDTGSSFVSNRQTQTHGLGTAVTLLWFLPDWCTGLSHCSVTDRPGSQPEGPRATVAATFATNSRSLQL